MIRACIFDLDGVIVDTAKYHYLAWRRLAYELGIPFTEQDNERLKGVSRMRSLEIVLEIGGVVLSDFEKQKCAERKNEWFIGYINAMKPNEIFPGAIELIRELKVKGIQVGLASSSKNASTVLLHLGITSLFDVIVDGTMISKSKPDPEIFLLTAKKLQRQNPECIVFEDAEAGVEAAHRAGMQVIGVGSSEILNAAEMVVGKIGEFKSEMLKQVEDARVS